MTRPVDRNGLGLSAKESDLEIRTIEAGMSLLPDNEAVYREWRRIVTDYGVCGLQVHDARLVAAMLVNQVGHILTFNVADFSRFSKIKALHPDAV